MVDRQIAGRGVRNPEVLEAMREVPREEFVEEGFANFAYEDSPLPIADGQTISQPYVVALMLEAAKISSGDRVLEVGSGSGYAAAVMSMIADQVYTIERHEKLGRSAGERLSRLGYDNVEVRVGDGTAGWPEAAPFNAVIVAAGAPGPPKALKEQLEFGGRLIIPVGEKMTHQSLLRITRTSATDYEEENLGAVRFVPLVGEQDWVEMEETRSHPRR